jgi:hypothetical protein
VLVLLRGRDSLADLPGWARNVAGGLLLAAFALLVIGSLLAVRAAHGGRERERVLGGQALKRWTEREIAKVTSALAWASGCCVTGLLLVVGALAVAWVTTDAAPAHLVRVTTNAGELCGELLSADREAVVVRTDGSGEGGVAVPQETVVSLRPTGSCGGAEE